jgi:hypothetical protein
MHENHALQRNSGGAMDFASHLQTDVFAKSAVTLRIYRFVSQVDLVVPDGDALLCRLRKQDPTRSAIDSEEVTQSPSAMSFMLRLILEQPPLVLVTSRAPSISPLNARTTPLPRDEGG